jgi:hypothetical protein
MEERNRKKRERDEDSDKYTQTGKLRKKYSKTPGTRTSASEAVLSSKSALKGVSKKINYEALKVSTGSLDVLVYGSVGSLLWRWGFCSTSVSTQRRGIFSAVVRCHI